MTRLVIAGGRIVDQAGERAGDVVVDAGRVVAVTEGVATSRRRHRARRPRLRGVPGVRRPPRPPARAGPRGRRDGRDGEPGRRARGVHGGRGDAQHRSAGGRAGVVELVRALGERAGLCDVHPSGCITVGRAGEVLAPYAELVAAGVRLFTDDGDGRAGPAPHAPGDGVLAGPRHGARPALRGGGAHPRRRHARRTLLQRPRPPRMAGRGRGADGAPRHRAVPAHRCPVAPAAPVDGAERRDGAGGEGRGTDDHRRGRSPPPEPHRRRAARLRPRVQGQPAAAHRRGRRGPGRRAGRRHDRRRGHRPRPAPGRATRSGRSTRRRPGWSGWRRRSACACRCCSERGCRSSRSSARCPGARRRSPGCRVTADRSPPASRPTSPCSIRRPAGRWCRRDWPAAATTRRSSAGRCTAGCDTRCWPACRP